MTTVAPPRVTELTEAELGEVIAWGDDDARAGAIAELDRRDVQRRRAGRAREGQRNRHGEWETVARANFAAAEEYCRGDANMLNRAAAARGVTAWSLWHGAEDLARRDASQELLTFWDYVQSRPPSPMEYEKHARGSETGMGGYGEVNAAGSVNGEPSRVNTDAGEWRERHEMKTAENAAAFAGLRARAAAIAGAPAAPTPGTGVATTGGDVEISPGPGSVVPPPARQRPDAAAILGRVLNETGRYFADHVWFRTRAPYVAITAWNAHAAARDADRNLIWRVSPRMLLTSAQNGSGKSTVMDMSVYLQQARAGRLAKVTPYGLAKLLGTFRETTFPDDAQNTFGATGEAAKELLGVLLNSYSQGGTWTSGKSSGKIEPVFGAVMLAGKDSLITKQADALADLLARSVIVRMERPPRVMPEVDDDAEDRGRVLGKALAAVMGALQGDLLTAYRELSREDQGAVVDDPNGPRTAQIWRPLRAVARVAGEPWVTAVEEAREELSAAAGDLMEVEDALAALAGGGDGGSFWDAF